MPESLRPSRYLLPVLAAGYLLLSGLGPAGAKADELAELGLPPDKGRDEVAAYCSACHSLRLVVQQGLSRSSWDELMDWMVEEQSMEPLEPDERALVLDYLSKHISIEAARERRK
jgi:hypothetical protein